MKHETSLCLFGTLAILVELLSNAHEGGATATDMQNTKGLPEIATITSELHNMHAREHNTTLHAPTIYCCATYMYNMYMMEYVFVSIHTTLFIRETAQLVYAPPPGGVPV